MNSRYSLILLTATLALIGCLNPKNKEKKLDSASSLYVVSQYHNNGNGTVTSPTGLLWTRCAYGQVWDPAFDTCTGTGGGTTFGAKSMQYCITNGYCSDLVTLLANAGPAYTACHNLTAGGLSTWRLPTVYELKEMAGGMDRPTMLLIFPNTPDDKYFWSASRDSSDANLARAISFSGTDFGADYGRTQTEVDYVKCVR